MKTSVHEPWTLALVLTCLLVPTAFAENAAGVAPAFLVDDENLRSRSPARLSGVLDAAVADLAAVDPERVVDGFVTFRGPSSAAARDAVENGGVRIVRDYGELGFVYVSGEAGALARLATVDDVRFVMLNEDLEYSVSTALLASRVRGVWDDRSTSTTPVRDGEGRVVDGRGIGVAVVDSGVDATHPDLEPAVVVNQKFVCASPGLTNGANGMCAASIVTGSVLAPGGGPCTTPGWVEAANTDASSGHGTHVAGTVLGRGIASDGRFMGAAPGASLYALSVGEGINVLSAVEALAWVWCNHDKVTPAIRVVTNSWGNAGEFQPGAPVNVLVDRLVDEGVVVLFAAGNDGGDGTTNTISGFARNPTPGVVSVANYDDGNSGTREGTINPSSSRGAITDANPEDWPDVAAPGTAVVAPRGQPGPVTAALGNPVSDDGRVACCVILNMRQESFRHQPYYIGATGTSMATPQVAGIVALLLQQNPDLTPAQVEDVLEDAATPVSDAGDLVLDAGNPTTPTNHAAGHGLVDALAALRDARVNGTAGSIVPPVAGIPAVYTPTPVIAANPQSTLHAKWVAASDAELQIQLGELRTGDAAAFPVTVGQDARFRVEGPAGSVEYVPASVADTDGALGLSARTSFHAPGTWVVEAQLLFDDTYLAVDAFHVEVVA